MIGRAYNSPWTLFFAVLVVASFLFGWVFPASMLAFKPGVVTINNGQVTLYRVFTSDALGLRRPIMSYKEVVRPLTPNFNGGHPCVQRGGPFRYVSAQPVGSWSLAWAQDCISDPAGYHWEAAWIWHIGAVQLGPVRASVTVLAASEAAR